jgi:hypothetical protein
MNVSPANRTTPLPDAGTDRLSDQLKVTLH